MEEVCSGFERAFGFVRRGGKSYWGGEKVYGKSGEKNVDIVLMLAHNGCISKRGIGMTLDKKQHTASVGLAGCVGLFSLLLVSLVTPLTSGRAHAEGGDEDINNEGTDGEFGGFDGEGEEYTDENGDGIMPLAATNSTVTISFSPTAATGTVTPVDSTGAKAKVDVKATVRVQNSGGYSVYVGSNSSQLKNGANVIDSVESATSYANLPVNRWGYSFVKGTTVQDSYKAMPATLRSTALDSNTSTSIKDETRTYMLSFAANIGSDKPAGTYTNQVTMSVVSSPLEVSNEFGIDTMQEMTSAICSSVAAGTTDQLRDTRDGKYYWVSKLADGKCWMTQNLDLDLNSSTTPLVPATSDVSASWTPNNGVWDPDTGYEPAYTATTASSSTILADNTGQRSWSLGNYRITNPTTSNDCGYPKNDASQCTAQFTAYTTPTTQNKDANAHYILGNHYQWNAATAGTGGTISSGQATSSICPKGWKLPESNSTAVGSFGGLINAGSIGTDVAKLTSAPYYFVRGGVIYQAINLFRFAGDQGRYWSSTPHSSGANAYYLGFWSTSSISPSSSSSRQLGFSVRCIAR